MLAVAITVAVAVAVEKVNFYLRTTFKKNESGRDFQRGQIWNDCSQKQKKNCGSHPLERTIDLKSVVFIQRGNRLGNKNYVILCLMFF